MCPITDLGSYFYVYGCDLPFIFESELKGGESLLVQLELLMCLSTGKRFLWSEIE